MLSAFLTSPSHLRMLRIQCLDKAEGMQSKADDFRISAGQRLLEAKERVKAGEPGHTNWSHWVAKNVKRSDRDVRRCIALVKPGVDPTKAREQEKATRRETDAKYRERQKEKRTRTCPESSVFQNLARDPEKPATDSPYDAWAANMDRLWSLAPREWREQWLMING